MATIFIPWRNNYMNLHKDYEIYEKKNGKYYFDVEYLGTYCFATMEDAVAGVQKAKDQVADILEEIDKKNKKYYEKIRKQEALLRKQLHEQKLKERTEPQRSDRLVESKEVTKTKVCRLFDKGYSNVEVQLELDYLTMQQISALRVNYEKRLGLQED